MGVEHEVLGLRHHLVTGQKAFTDIISSWAHHNLLSASQIIHKLTAGARAFISGLLLSLLLLRLIAHASIVEAVASLFRAHTLQLLAEGLGAVHFVIGSLVEHHIRRAVLTSRALSMVETIASTLSSLSEHVLAIGKRVGPELLSLVLGSIATSILSSTWWLVHLSYSEV